MPKTDRTFDPALYAPVADRIKLFYAAHETGRIITELVSRTGGEIVFKALVYRRSDDRRPAATGWAAEREGDGDVNLVACLENTETSAVGRALANLGFAASAQRPSAEEMAKAARVRARFATPASAGQSTQPLQRAARPALRSLDSNLQARADAVADTLALLRAAERAGVRRSRAARLRTRLVADSLPAADIAQLNGLLRRWIERRRLEAIQRA